MIEHASRPSVYVNTHKHVYKTLMMKSTRSTLRLSFFIDESLEWTVYNKLHSLITTQLRSFLFGLQEQEKKKNHRNPAI